VFQNEGAANGWIGGQRATQSSLIIDIFDSTAYQKYSGLLELTLSTTGTAELNGLNPSTAREPFDTIQKQFHPPPIHTTYFHKTNFTVSVQSPSRCRDMDTLVALLLNLNMLELITAHNARL
jgi:hypothetical protein